jgi:hypothetical protein
VTVVATIREPTWDELLAADGESGEFAKAVAARARAFKVPSALDADGEEPRARELYPNADLSGGLGAALAATGKQPEPPDLPAASASAAATGAVPRAWLSGVWGDRFVIAPLAGCVVAVAAVLVIGLASSITKPVPPTIEEQAEAVTSDGNAGERTSQGVGITRADFHGTGTKSYVFGFRDQDRGYDATSRADEIRVYDVVGGRLVDRFRFEPENPAVYVFRGVDDVDGDGAEELIGAWGPLQKPGALLVPFALEWDEDRDAYRMVSLRVATPELGPPVDRSKASELADRYGGRIVYRNTVGEGSVSGYPVEDFALNENASRLISGYYASDPDPEGPAAVEIQAETFDTQGATVKLRACEFDGEPHPRIVEQLGRPLWTVIGEEWAAMSAERACIGE